MWYKVKKIYVWTKQVRPYRFNPWSNTLAYYPLNWDIKDYSWNWYNGTWNVWTETYHTLSSWIKVAQFSTSWAYATTTFNWTPKTVSVWLYKSTNLGDANNDNWKFPLWQNSSDGSNWWWFRLINKSSRPNQIIYQKGSSLIYKTLAYKDKRLNLIVTTDWSSTYYYINWEYVTSMSWAIASDANLYMGFAPWNTESPSWSDGVGTLYWYISEVILENVVWDSTKITYYYNQTKSNYWL